MSRWIPTGQGSYKKLPDGRITIDYIDPNGKRRQVTAHMTVDEVLQKLSENARAKGRIKAGLCGATWDTAWDAWLTDAKLHDLSENWIRKSKRIIDSFKAHCKVGMDQVTHKHVSAWMEHEALRLKALGRSGQWASTVNGYRSQIGALFDAAKRMGVENPVKLTDPYPEKKRVQRTLTLDEYRDVWAVSEPEFRDLLDFMLLTGCRFGEMRKMERSDIDFKTMIWTLKKRKADVPLAIPLSAHLGEIIARRGQADRIWVQWLQHAKYRFRFGAKVTHVGAPISSSFMRRVLRRRCKLAGVEPFRIHDIRHAAASWAQSAGADLNHIQAMLGHSSPNMTRNYAHGDVSKIIMDVQEKVGGLMDGARGKQA